MSEVHATLSGTTVTVSNGMLSLGFDLAHGGRLASLRDPVAEWEFIRDTEAPSTLFRLALIGRDSREVQWLEAGEATQLNWDTRREGERLTVLLTASGFARRALSVTVAVTLTPDSALSRWRGSVSGLAADEAVHQLALPLLTGVLRVGDPAPGEALALPVQSEGWLFRDPFPVVDRLPLMSGMGPDTPQVGVGQWHGRYPGGIPVQLMLYLTERSSLYVATHDPDQHVKHFAVGPSTAEGSHPALSASHLPGEASGEAYATPYDTVVGVFQGDWYDGADIYKAWARQQWWCAHKLGERDIPDWLRRAAARDADARNGAAVGHAG